MRLSAHLATVPDDYRGEAGIQQFAVGPLAIAVPADTPSIFDPAGPLAIVGDAFTANGGRVASLGPGQAHAIVTSQGRWVTANLWGRYLAFWVDPRDGSSWALRDPSGAVPLYRRSAGDRPTLFTGLDALPRATHEGVSVDGAALAHRLAYPNLPTRRAPLNGITELMPGEAVCVDDPGRRVSLWLPWSFAGSGSATDENGVRNAIDRVVAALTDGGRPLLLELSGGLDSSIVAGSLAEAEARWRAATLVTPGADGDERRYARSVAERWRADLAEFFLMPGEIDLLAPPPVPGMAPSGYAILAAVDAMFATCAARDGADLVSGTGGDNVFCALRSAAPLLDRLSDDGLRGGLATLGDLARLTQASTREILVAAVRYWRTDRRRPVRWTQDASFLRRDAIPALDPHPWLARPTHSRPGTRAHIAAILRAHAVVATLARAQDGRMLFPLLAQPVLEACLAIPTWRWIAGGVDRAPARQAFADRLPAMVRERRTKGRLASLLAPAYDAARRAIGERLCEGRLAALGLIDTAAVAQATAAPAQSDGAVYMRLLELLDAELWAEAIARRPAA